MARVRQLAAALSIATAAVVAQTSWDVPHRGALVYDRATEAFEIAPPPSSLDGELLITPSAQGGHEWRYLTGRTADVPKGFEAPGFDDSAWRLGRGEFGPDEKTVARTRTLWNTEAVCLRTRVPMPKKPKALVLDIDHDDGIRVWLNGRLVVSDDGWGRGRRYVVAGDDLDAWKRGDNVVAVRCVNTGGALYCDIGMTALRSLPRGARSTPAIQKLLRETNEAANKVRRELFGPYRPPALLLQGELDKDGRRVRLPPADLRDVPWWIATDLRFGLSGGSVQADAYRLFRLGDLEIKGRAAVADAEGWQTINVTVKNRDEPAPRSDGTRHVERFVMPHVAYGFDGEIEIRRRIEKKGSKARVVEFTSRMHGRILRGKHDKWRDHAADLEQRETWKLADVRHNQDAGFRAMVQRSTDAGVKRLREQIKDVDKGNLAAEKPDSNRTYHTGRLALALLALVKAGLPKDDEVVVAGFDELRRRRIHDTYSLGNALMAMEALYSPQSELSDLKAGVIDRPLKRELPAADLELMEEWTETLFGNADPRVDPNYLLRFHYVGGADYDNSVNQYGLLGLYSAHLCGVRIPLVVWEAAANHLIASQSPEGPKVSLKLVDYRTHARGGDRSTGSRIRARARGWNYKEPKDQGVLTPTWGSMTCAGIAGLAICEAAFGDHGNRRTRRLETEVTTARHDGFAWLAEHMTMRCHAGAIERQRRWLYYYAYSLERAALLSGIALIQDRDWYFEAAMVLALAQQADGNWPGELMAENTIEINAMALLTLVQSTRPVLTGK